MPTDTIRLGIIGTGLAVEQLQWPALRRMTDRFTVTAFCDTDRAAAERFAGYSGTPMDGYTPDHEELLRRDDVDAVLISLPIPLNYPVTRDALEAGKQVICEKPTGASAEDATGFLDLERRYPDRTVLIAENWFYRDDLRHARTLLDDAIIGRVHLVAWRSVSQLVPREGQFSSTPWRQQAEYVGGPQLDAGVHQIAQLRLLCGDASHLSGAVQDANGIFDGPSDLALTIRFVSGAAGSYAASYTEMPVHGEDTDLRLYGTEGVMRIGRGATTVTRPDGSSERWTVAKPDGGYFNEFLDFHHAVTGSGELVGTIGQSVRTMEWITAGLASAERGETVALATGPTPLSAQAVPLWRPPGSDDPFDGLGVEITHERSGA